MGKNLHISESEMLDHLELYWRYFRYISDVTMDGRYPCWTVRTPLRKLETKTLREAIVASILDSEEKNKII